jgi:hypothetical protein
MHTPPLNLGYAIWIENGADIFFLFCEKAKKKKFQNGNGIIHNGNRIFCVEAEAEQCFLLNQSRKWNFGFYVMHNFYFTVVLHT